MFMAFHISLISYAHLCIFLLLTHLCRTPKSINIRGYTLPHAVSLLAQPDGCQQVNYSQLRLSSSLAEGHASKLEEFQLLRE